MLSGAKNRTKKAIHYGEYTPILSRRLPSYTALFFGNNIQYL